MISVYNKQPKDIANDVIALFKAQGLSDEDAKKAALTSLQITLSVGVYPAYHPYIKKTENLLNKDLGLSLTNVGMK